MGCALLSLSDKGVARLKLGGWQSIKDLNDPHVWEIGEFALSEYNKEVEHDVVEAGGEGGDTSGGRHQLPSPSRG